MPPPNGKIKPKVNTAPSFADQIAGIAASEEQKHPERTPINISEMGPLSKLMYKRFGADAVTGPFGSIYYNPEQMQINQSNIADVIPHEMTHVGQGPLAYLQSMFSPTARQKFENQAINYESMRPYRKTDINLPINTAPSKKVKR